MLRFASAAESPRDFGRVRFAMYMEEKISRDFSFDGTGGYDAGHAHLSGLWMEADMCRRFGR